MRFHKSETAFVVLVAVILMAAAVTVDAYWLLSASKHLQEELHNDLTLIGRLMFLACVLEFTAVVFGIFFIYPLIRTQAHEEGKLRAMTQSLSARSETLEQAALTDSLTGMQNRRYFDDALKEYLDEFRRVGRPVGLMIFDLDHFKNVNDTHGHDVGDDVLRAVANCLKDMTRYHDVVARLGGEEFAVVAPNMDAPMLMRLADRIRSGIASLPIRSGNVHLRVTASVGLAVWDGEESAEEFFRRTDQQLYRAKRLGRNRVSA